MPFRDPEKHRIACRDYQRRWRALNPDLDRIKRQRYRSNRRGRIGLLLTEYNRLKAIQGNRCAICNNLEGKEPLLIDHDHGTGKVRGLLCRRCNGLAQSIEIVQAVLAYMAKKGGENIGRERTGS